MRATTVLVLLIGLPISTAGCSKPLRATAIQVGKSLNRDNSVSRHATSFQASDTIYVSVLTEGRGAGTITARCTYAGRLVSEPQKTVSYQGDAATEFHIQNSSGFPAGEYEVEILIDDKPHGSRKFRVE